MHHVKTDWTIIYIFARTIASRIIITYICGVPIQKHTKINDKKINFTFLYVIIPFFDGLYITTRFLCLLLKWCFVFQWVYNLSITSKILSHGISLQKLLKLFTTFSQKYKVWYGGLAVTVEHIFQAEYLIIYFTPNNYCLLRSEIEIRSKYQSCK